MYWTKYLIPTLKETPQEAESASHQLMLRAGLIRMLMAGVYSYLPFGLRVLNNIETIIRSEMDAAGAHELLLPALQPMELWQKTGRDKTIADVMIRFTDRRGRNVCLGPTHEEVITDLVSNHVSSYKQMPLTLYQIQTKFRDEMRPRFGLVRCCEFIMKDAYSFDVDEAALDVSYQTMFGAYNRIFKRLGLSCLAVEADSGVMGGSVSHEFMVPAACGEDFVSVCSQCTAPRPYQEGTEPVCPKCKGALEKVNTIEVGHIFKLGTKYTSMLNANYLNAKGQSLPIVMGCYGIGVSRLIATVIEQNHDEKGIVWPKEVAPFDILISPLDVTNDSVVAKARELHDTLEGRGYTVLLDDRDERAGVKFKDAELVGIPVQIVIGRDFIANGTLEYKNRRTGGKTVDTPAAILALVKESMK
ncbi:MAG TPA: proline--tRNA ligase [Candidatus Omnitrophota bacterium]|nr:proline--tRNA ligase [Candidatus Omnitrophota bacterium]HQO38008.1 proline--tRNA ligase [Candidatus Omnitrophota bacterium]